MTTPMEQLKAATWDIHQRLEATPYAKALLDGVPDMATYACHLRCMAVIHASLERTLAASGDTHVRSVWHDGLAKLDLLLADLDHFEPALYPDVDAAVDAALQLAAAAKTHGLESPARLLGWLYVLEGSIMGAAMFRDSLGSRLGLTVGQPGLVYLTNYGATAKARWADFGHSMNNAFAATPGLLSEAKVGAVELFTGLKQLFSALDPAASRSHRATTFNPEAGAHPVPQDVAVLRPALRSGWLCLREFPYVQARYGLRGERFTASDSMWLTSMAQTLETEALAAQVDWLAGVLSARGLPRLILERHLELLYLELTLDAPGLQNDWDKLAAVARSLREQRRQILDEAAFERNARAAWEELQSKDPELAARLTDAGELLVAVGIDAELGLPAPPEEAGKVEAWLSSQIQR